MLIFVSFVSSLARQCAQLWLRTRESLGYPLGVISQPGNFAVAREVLEEAAEKVYISDFYVFFCSGI